MRISDWSSDVCSSDLAKIVIQISLGRQAALFAQGPEQNGRNHFLGRGLAVATGNTYDRQLEQSPPRRGYPQQRLSRIAQHKLRQIHSRVVPLDDGRARARLKSRCQIIMPIVSRALQCQKKLAFGNYQKRRVGGKDGEKRI